MKYIFALFFIFSPLFAKYPSLDEMIGQMLMVGVGGNKPSDKWVKKLKDDIEKGKVGGIVFLKNNIENKKQLKRLVSYFKFSKSRLPIFIAISQEGGSFQTLNPKNGFNLYPSPEEIAQKMTLKDSYDTYKTMSDELSRYGFNLNFAPVVDLSTNEKLQLINVKKRSYSNYEEIVIAYSNTFLEASKDSGIISVLKHFPGQGSSLGGNNWEYRELKPYYNFIKYKKVDAIMVGHIILDRFDNIYPALLSKKIVKNLLRDQLKFDGVVFSENMNIEAIDATFGLKESVILAVNASVDILVFSSYFTKTSSVVKDVTKIIKEAIISGRISKKQIEDSYRRIQRLKNVID